MAKKAKRTGGAGTVEVVRIDSVRDIKEELEKRLVQAGALVKKLKQGATVLIKPQRHQGPALATAKRIELQLKTAIKLMSKSCGNNDLTTPYKIQMKPKRKG